MWPPLALNKSLTRVGIDSKFFAFLQDLIIMVPNMDYCLHKLPEGSAIRFSQPTLVENCPQVFNCLNQFPGQSSTETWF